VKIRNTFLVSVVLLLSIAHIADGADDSQRLANVKKLYEQRNWEEVLREAQGPADQNADFEYYAGMALARLERWKEARDVFSTGARKAPREARFLAERAGTEYKLNDFMAAKRDLRNAMRLDAADSYAAEFLGTIYVLEGNVEAALKYWNRVKKPRLAAVDAIPPPKTRKILLDRAVLFSPPGTLELASFLNTDAMLENLGEFPARRIDLAPVVSSTAKNGDEYQATLRISERNGWGSSPQDGLIALLRGLPYQTVFPSYYNLRGESINFDSLVRWDAEKRRVAITLALPVFRHPERRLQIFFDARDENWNLSQTFFGSPVPITDSKMKRYAGGADLRLVENGRWDLTVAAEGVSREFRNVPTGALRSATPFFVDCKTADAWIGAHRSLIRIPERRFTLDGSGEVRAGRNYATGLGAFGSTRGELKSRWLPKARGDDYEFVSGLRGGRVFGDVPLDELYQLGVERDNDLWLRGHAGTQDGRKGSAPLGRRYVLVNSELNKTMYNGAFLGIQLGPFFDTGAVADPSGLFGSQKWLFDTGLQARIRVLGSVSVVLSYGRDLRHGTGVFYGTSVR
jgi:tetratricopeptide (TPR) repeat protein